MFWQFQLYSKPPHFCFTSRHQFTQLLNLRLLIFASPLPRHQFIQILNLRLLIFALTPVTNLFTF